jgi:hypothetical protein
MSGLLPDDPQVLRINDRCADELNAACRKGGFQCRISLFPEKNSLIRI